MKLYVDKGLELFGFGAPSDGTVKNDPVFGSIEYIQKTNEWYSPTFFKFDRCYTTYKGKNVWYGTYIKEPIKSTYHTFGTKFRYLMSMDGNIELVLKVISKAINEAEEKYEIFKSKIDFQTVYNGRESDFFFDSIFFTTQDNLGGDVAIVAAIFKNKIFYTIFNSDMSFYVYIPKVPSIYNAVTPLSATSLNFKDPISKLDATALEGYFSENTEEYNTIQKEFQSQVEGEYDDEDTDVKINPSEDTNVDVDIRIDLTPDREQKLLKALTCDSEFEISQYTLNGFKQKINKNYDNLLLTVNNIFDNIQNNINILNNSEKELFINSTYKISSDISSKEDFIDELSVLRTSVHNSLLSLKQLTESNDIPYAKSQENINTSSRVFVETPLSTANLLTKDDFQYLASQLLSTRAYMNISQMKYYTKMLLDKIDTSKISTSQLYSLDNAVNRALSSSINLCSLLSQGNRALRKTAYLINS